MIVPSVIRRGTLHTLISDLVSTLPDVPSDYPLDKATRTALDEAATAHELLSAAQATWQAAHDALGEYPKEADSSAEIAAWEAMQAARDEHEPTLITGMHALADFLRTKHGASAAKYELGTLARRDVVRKRIAELETELREIPELGETYRQLASWSFTSYAHDDKPRGFGTSSNQLHRERVLAYWRNKADGYPESTPLPGDYVHTAGKSGTVVGLHGKIG